MSLAACPNEVLTLLPLLNDPNSQLPSIQLIDLRESSSTTSSSNVNTLLAACDRDSHPGHYTVPAQQQAPRLKSGPSQSSFLPSSIHPTMNYSSAPPTFTSGLYGTREHPNDLKNGYLTESRSISEYMRGEYNPIVESLNFVSNTVSYDAVPSEGFSSWNPDAVDPDSELKPRVDFRALTLGGSDMCSRHPCVTNDCRSLTNPVSEQLYGATGRQLSSLGRNQDVGQFDLLSHRDHPPPLFEVNGYNNVSRRAYESKLLFNGVSPTALTTNLNGSSFGLMRTNSDPNSNPPLLHTRSVAPPTSVNSTKALAVSAGDVSVANSIMMTPDSSTAGFLTNKFATSSDDGEVSPTPTNTSSCSRTANRTRKAAPTLATGRRNLKNEPVDPDEADRRMKRRERNRKSAQKCRERKVQRTQELQAQVECLQIEINRLTQERDSLRSEARQFVNLLQIHCPGVAIPHMSCLTEHSDHVESRRDAFGSLMQTTALPKCDTSRDNIPNGWRMRPGMKQSAGPDPHSSSGQNGSFSTLPSSMTFSTHGTPMPQKSLFPFSSSDTTNGLARESDVILSTSSAASGVLSNLNSHSLGRPSSEVMQNIMSGQDPASSSSSSSSSSGYELTFPNIGTPVAPSSLIPDHLEEVTDTVASTHSTASLTDRSSLTLSSPTCQQPVQTSVTNQPGLSGNDNPRVKCEAWETSAPSGQQQYIGSEPLTGGRPAPLSPLSPSAQRAVYPASTESTTSNRCDLRQVEPPTKLSRPLDGACFS
ncbi:bZIP transcription factor [Opisthorchis viverrini]|uniref:Uncharacterized protein n=2 Tax=Opisthorchis viverrini TaxID=6198 RepID=A0A075A736_OPIVI|nr:hypothetical protein T265_00022 [Opisthorchis viverrini]KER34152.1 hypothetical protein T265_00022 [Opisthorchis viverrini]OON23452.1 bZIP transcription factor [Opisthorchis viverrini]